MSLKRAEAKLKAKLQEDYKQLKKLFQAGRFREMARLLGEHTELVSPEGRRVRGKDSLERYWASAKKGRRKWVEFKSVCVYVSEVKNVREKKNPSQTVIHTAHEITEFRLLSTEPGGAVVNCTGSWERSLCHPRACLWII
ncbi:MAG: hypothetical protein WCC06_03180 [Candidatus Aminicenantales bacterium]